MMYKLSSIAENVNLFRPEIELHTRPIVQMRIYFTDKERVLRSPLRYTTR